MSLRSPVSHHPSAGSVLVALILWSACGGTMQAVRLTTQFPPEVWMPDAARAYLEGQGFTVTVLENSEPRIRIYATREGVALRSVVEVTMTHPYSGTGGNVRDPMIPPEAEIRVLRYVRDSDGRWTPTDPEPLRALAEELANVIKTGAGA